MAKRVTRRRFNRVDLAFHFFDLAYSVLGGIADAVLQMRNTAALHANWVAAQHEFRQEAAQAIESMTTGEVE